MIFKKSLIAQRNGDYCYMGFCIVVREKKERVRENYAGSEKKGKKGDYGTDIPC